MAGKQMEMTGAEMVLQALKDNGVEHVSSAIPAGRFFRSMTRLQQEDAIEHILVRHEQGAGHMAEGYARSTGKARRGRLSLPGPGRPTWSPRCRMH
jgi:acetolactate synthase-1/2/3 large subunit